MKILAAGGGSGGHATPVVAVINELASSDPSLEVVFVSDRKFGPMAVAIFERAKVPVEMRTIASGKLRRYHNISWWRQLLDLPTVAHNFGDMFLVGVGYMQSLWLLLRFRPDVVFAKGGFVCLPVGIAAATLRIPLVLHDSDTVAGLTNRILSRWATRIATGAPVENYPGYKAEVARYVGIPVDADFQPVDASKQAALKATLGFPDIEWPLVVVTGGGLGASRLNEAMSRIAKDLLAHKIAIFHITGKDQYDRMAGQLPDHPCYIVKPFVATSMAEVLGAADVIVTRAGATALAEMAALAKPTIIIPSRHLVGGHQLKNASIYEIAKAALVLDEQKLSRKPLLLEQAIELLIDHPSKSKEMAQRFHAFARPDAAVNVATILVEVFAGKSRGERGSRQ